jgi:hypothetical protein
MVEVGNAFSTPSLSWVLALVRVVEIVVFPE